MQIELKISVEMDKIYNNYNGKDEGRRVRIPQDLRDLYKLKLYNFLNLRADDGRVTSLEIWPAYKGDVVANSMVAYVTSEIFEMVKIRGEEVAEPEVVEPIEGLTIGCDPELFLVDKNSGKLMDASRYFKKWQTVGSDGMLLELRPLPSNSEETLTENLYNLILRGKDEIVKNRALDPSAVKMVGASFYGGVAAGFHVHFGLPQELIFGGNRTSGVIKNIVKLLDYYLGIPAMIPEGNEDCARRSTPYITYGKPGSYRVEPPPPTLEYRVPGGSILRHPSLTKGMLGLGATVVEDAVSRMRHCTDNFKDLNTIMKDSDLIELYPKLPSMGEIVRTICSTETRKAMYHLDRIADDVGQMVTFRDRSESVAEFFKVLYGDIKFSNDIENNWRDYYHG